MNGLCFRKNEITNDIYQRYPSFFEDCPDLLIPEEPIERYKLIREPTPQLYRELSEYLEIVDRKAYEDEFIKRIAHNLFKKLSQDQIDAFNIYPSGNICPMYSIYKIDRDFWIIDEFENQDARINENVRALCLGIDNIDEYYRICLSNYEDYRMWYMYYLLYGKTPIDIYNKYHSELKNTASKEIDEFEWSELYHYISMADQEVKEAIENKDEAIKIYEKLGVPLDLRNKIIEGIAKHNVIKFGEKKVLPYEIGAVAFDNYDSTKMMQIIEKSLPKYILSGLPRCLPDELFIKRDFMKLMCRLSGYCILRNELYRQDDEIVEIAKKKADLHLILDKKYFKKKPFFIYNKITK